MLGALLIAPPTRADTVGPVQWPDGPLNRWFKQLQRPDNHLRPQFDENNPTSCCGAGDTVNTKFKVEPGTGPHPDDVWYAWLDDAWVKIPPEKIILDFAAKKIGAGLG